jgi:hypothetical protein
VRIGHFKKTQALAFGQYVELGPGLEELPDTITEAGAGEAAERHYCGLE